MLEGLLFQPHRPADDAIDGAELKVARAKPLDQGDRPLATMDDRAPDLGAVQRGHRVAIEPGLLEA